MKNIAWSIIIALSLRSLFAAEADLKEDLQSAVKKLGQKAGYSWTATPKSSGSGITWRQGPTEGKAEKGGYTYCTLTYNDASVELAFRRDKSAIKRDGNWQSAEELEGDNAWIARRLKAFKAPVAEAEDLLTKTKGLKKSEDGLYSADLTEEGVKELLTRIRRGVSKSTETKGWVKFWLKEDSLVKYEYNTKAKLTIGDDQREVEIDRTTTVEIKDVGTTKVSVPDEAKKKLS